MEFGPHVDAVFSNAALHWMKDADAVIGRVARALPNGRFVAEMGGSTAAPRRGISRTAGRCRPAVAAGLRAHQSAGAVCLFGAGGGSTWGVTTTPEPVRLYGRGHLNR